MGLFVNCSGECCVCGAGSGCLAGNGDDDYFPATKEQVIKRLDKGQYSSYTDTMKNYLKTRYGYDYDSNSENKNIEHVAESLYPEIRLLTNDEAATVLENMAEIIGLSQGRGSGKTLLIARQVEALLKGAHALRATLEKPIRKFNSRDIIFDDYRQAKLVLDSMYDIIHKYGLVTVADFMDLSDISPQGYSNTKYGWRSFDNNVAVYTKDDKYYYINLPDPVPLFRE